MRRIIWTSSAKDDYAQNIDYLLKEWSIHEAVTFSEEVESILSDLQKGLTEYPLTDVGEIRKCVVCKQIILFYRINNDDIELIRFWNTHQDNKKLKL